MLSFIEGFGARLVPKAPFAVQRLGGADASELRVHCMVGGSAAVTSAGEQVQVRMLHGDEGATLRVTAGPAEREWRIITSTFRCLLPIEMAVLGDGGQAGLEFRFNRVVAPRSLWFPDGSAMPFGDDAMTLQRPVGARVPSEKSYASQLRKAAGALRDAGKTLVGVSSLEDRIRVAEVSTHGGARRELTYLIPLDKRQVVMLHVRVAAEGLEIATLFANRIAASVAAET